MTSEASVGKNKNSDNFKSGLDQFEKWGAGVVRHVTRSVLLVLFFMMPFYTNRIMLYRGSEGRLQIDYGTNGERNSTAL
jgi:hypothetical protein